MVAATYAARHPEHPARLVLVNPVVRMDVERSAAAYERLGGPEAGETLRSFRESPGEETFARFLRVCFPLVTSFELSAELSVRADWSPEALIHFHRTLAPALDLREALGRIRVPTLVVAGEDDPEMTLEGAKEAAAALPPGLGRFTSYPRARHAVFRDVPEAFRDVRGFLLEGEDA
jgi:proline iminopeptidase